MCVCVSGETVWPSTEMVIRSLFLNLNSTIMVLLPKNSLNLVHHYCAKKPASSCHPMGASTSGRKSCEKPHQAGMGLCFQLSSELSLFSGNIPKGFTPYLSGFLLNLQTQILLCASPLESRTRQTL